MTRYPQLVTELSFPTLYRPHPCPLPVCSPHPASSPFSSASLSPPRSPHPSLPSAPRLGCLLRTCWLPLLQHLVPLCSLHHRHCVPTTCKHTAMEDPEGSSGPFCLLWSSSAELFTQPGKHPRCLEAGGRACLHLCVSIPVKMFS